VLTIGKRTQKDPARTTETLEESLEAERAFKEQGKPKSDEEAAAREALKREPIRINPEAMRRHGFPEYMIRWFVEGVHLGVHHDYLDQYRKDYPLSPEAHEHVAAECRRFIALDAIEPVADPFNMSDATIICPWVVIVKPD
jgi:hypothetical protein